MKWLKYLLGGLLIVSPKLFAVEVQQMVKDSLKQYWEEKLGEEVENLAVAETEEGKLYAKVLVTKTRIKFMDKKGKIKKEYKRTNRVETTKAHALEGKPIVRNGGAVDRIQITRNGEFIGITTPLLLGYDYNERTDFKVMNPEGEVLWKAETGVYGGIYLSPSGDYAIGEPPGINLRIPILFIDSTGIKKLIDHPNGRGGCKICFSSNGDRWATLCGAENAWLILFDRCGKEIWRRELSDTDVGLAVKFSNDGNIIFTSAWKQKASSPLKFLIFSFSKDGKLLDKKEAENWELNSGVTQ